MGKSGVGNGIRTRDLCLGKATLYQLSYSHEKDYFKKVTNQRGLSIDKFYLI